jgi:protein involved in sex pheromone biosynthesis
MKKLIVITLFGTMILLNSCEQSSNDKSDSIDNKIKKDLDMDDTTTTEHASDSTQ